MKIEKLTDNKIRIIVKTEEISKNKIDLNNFMINNISYQKFFLDILDRAEKEFGFNTKDCKLLIEMFSSLDDICVFTITKYSISKKKKHQYKLKSKHTNYCLKNPIFKFNTFEEFCNLCEALNTCNLHTTGIAKKISLYLYNNTYFLIFSNVNLTYSSFTKLFALLSEFSCAICKPHHFESRLLEYGKPIIKQNALKTGIKYFV